MLYLYMSVRNLKALQKTNFASQKVKIIEAPLHNLYQTTYPNFKQYFQFLGYSRKLYPPKKINDLMFLGFINEDTVVNVCPDFIYSLKGLWCNQKASLCPESSFLARQTVSFHRYPPAGKAYRLLS